MKGLLTHWFPGGSRLTALDFFVFGLLLIGMAILGHMVGNRVEDSETYVRGNRKISWWAAGIALVAAEVSALTVVGLPAASFHGDWAYFQFFVGATIARAFVAVTVVPLLFKTGGITPYAWLETRFGPWTRVAGACAFITTRLCLSAVRLLAACVAAGALMGWGPAPMLVLLTVIVLVGLTRGGVVAAVWTGVFQTGIVVGVGILSILFFFRRVDGGLGGVWSLTSAADKLRIFDLGGSPLSLLFFKRLFGDPPIFWGALIAGFLGSTASFGTDHEMTQKIMSTPDVRSSIRAIAVSFAGSLAVIVLYLSVGTLLFVYYKQNPGMALPYRVDQIYAHFAVTAMPRIMRGLVLSAIVLASIDFPLASLSTVFSVDLRRRQTRVLTSPATELSSYRRAAVVFALLIAALAFVFASSPSALSSGFKFGAVFVGPILGIFLFGIVSPQGGDREALIAFLSAAVFDAILLTLAERGAWFFGWSWILPIGTSVSAGMAWWLSRP